MNMFGQSETESNQSRSLLTKFCNSGKSSKLELAKIRSFIFGRISPNYWGLLQNLKGFHFGSRTTIIRQCHLYQSLGRPIRCGSIQKRANGPAFQKALQVGPASLTLTT